MENTKYSTTQLERYFKQNRVRWEQFYKSEREVIERIWSSGNPDILDIGCGCAGLGLALREKFRATRYTGVEINDEAAVSAKMMYPEARVIAGDFLKMSETTLESGSYDVVFSLSCIDWNNAFDAMFEKAWTMVRNGGVFIASFRLTKNSGINAITESFQYINYDGNLDGEIASYVVLNAADLMRRVRNLDGARRVFGYGYYGAPGKTAVTPYRELCFAVLAITKSTDGGSFQSELQLPDDIAESMLAAH